MRNIKLFTILISILFSLSSFGQIKVSSHADMPTETFVTKLSEEDMARFEESTTVFLYRDIDKKHLQKIKKIFEENWTLTEIKFEPAKDVKFEEDKFYLSMLEGEMPTTNMVLKVTEKARPNPKISYALLFWYPKRSERKQKLTCKGIARVELFPSIEKVKMIDTGENELLNWHPAFLKGYLVTMQKLILDGKPINIYTDYEDREQLSNLKTTTLYVPEYLLTRDYRLKPVKLEKLFKDYKYPHQAIEKDDLFELIQSSTEPIYYLVVTRSGSANVYFTIYRSDTGEMIYHKYKASKMMIKSGDFKLISGKIEGK